MVFRPVIFFFVFVINFVICDIAQAQGACSAMSEGESEASLQAKLQACEQDIAVHAEAIKKKQAEADSLQRDISVITLKISKTSAEIKARNLKITDLTKNIKDRTATIGNLEKRLESIRMSLAEMIRETNNMDNVSVPELVLRDGTLMDSLAALDSYMFLEEKLGKVSEEMKNTKQAVSNEKVKLEDNKQEEVRAKSLREIDKRNQEVQEKEKQVLLSYTKKEEQIYRDLIQQKKIIASKIKNTILRLSGGGELRFEEALNIARVAEAATGIRSAFILAILTQESGMNGVIGANLGRCYYNTPWKNKSGTVMSNAQKPSFLALMNTIGRDPDTTPVSCPISRDGQYGGAMGPSQFMPVTWWDVDKQTGYAKRVERATGSAPASPFNNLDAFTATALYLSDSVGVCRAAYSNSFNVESCGAARYYAGGNWKKFMSSYGKSVANRADQIQKDIDFLDTQ